MTISQLINETNGKALALSIPNAEVKSLVIDSRKPFAKKGSLFFAINGDNHDGHDFIHEMYEKGCRNFIVEQPTALEGANIICVANSIAALHGIVALHRSTFDIDVIGITGSNGKTIVKEWLYTCLASDKKITKSPHSYNSQIGVPLSVWQLGIGDELGIFEAGISKPNEMDKLERIIQPNIGIFTNLGSAHDEGFENRKQKLEEKSKLFTNSEVVIYNSDQPEIDFDKNGFSWGYDAHSSVVIDEQTRDESTTSITLNYKGSSYQLKLNFNDEASIENAMHCISVMLYFGYDQPFIQTAIEKLEMLPMRMALKKGIKGNYVIDDTYNNDLAGLEQALNFLVSQKQRSKKIAIISDLPQTGMRTEDLYKNVADLLISAQLDQIIAIGPESKSCHHLLPSNTSYYDTTDQLLSGIDQIDLTNAVILIKGARKYGFEKISAALEEKVHGTVLEINLDRLTNNLNFYRSKLEESTKLMVMVKAFAYGSGSFEIANLLQFHRVDYLGVAYADEGVQLRQNGIHLPIMVMNASEDSFEVIQQHSLEPVIYDIELLERFIGFLDEEEANVHLEIETGMNRLGVNYDELPKVIRLLRKHSNISIKSIFSHLAGADEKQHHAFSKKQASAFDKACEFIQASLNYSPIRHLVNSPGIINLPEYHYDMVRLGIGLHGIEPTGKHQEELLTISELKTVISQIHHISKGETIGYGRKGVAKNDMEIATIAIGYADGFSRAFSNGIGEVAINGKRASIVGNVCMDMCMVDITNIDARVGDEVEVFGSTISINELAEKLNTIPYEILTNVSQRVRRVYYQE